MTVKTNESVVAQAAGRSSSVRWWHWWPLLIGPVMIAVVIGGEGVGIWFFQTGHVAKRALETPSPFLAMTAVFILAFKITIERTPLRLIMLALAITLCCREFHFPGTHQGVYIALAAIGAWAFVWRQRLAKDFNQNTRPCWLIAMMWTYILSQIIARAHKHMLFDDIERLHVPIEEMVENTAHILLIIVSLLI